MRYSIYPLRLGLLYFRGVSLIGSRPFHTPVAYSRGCCGLFSYRVAQSLILAHILPLKPCYYLAMIPPRQNKAREALFLSSREKCIIRHVKREIRAVSVRLSRIHRTMTAAQVRE